MSTPSTCADGPLLAKFAMLRLGRRKRVVSSVGHRNAPAPWWLAAVAAG